MAQCAPMMLAWSWYGGEGGEASEIRGCNTAAMRIT